MGKRELVLAAVFVVLGLVVYQATAPPADPNRQGWSFSGIIEEIRREVRGNQARAEITRTQTIPAPDALREIRLINAPREVTVIGEDRADIEADLKVNSRAYDDAEAKRTAEASTLKMDHAGELLILTMDYPREGQQTATLSLRVPKRLAIRADEKGGKLTVSNVASVSYGGRGETIINDVPGHVQAAQRGSAVTATNIGSLRLSTVAAEVRVVTVRGSATMNLQGGDGRAEAIEGPIDVECRNAEIKFEQLEKSKGPIKINAIGGELSLAGLQVETRIDARRTDVRVNQPAAAPLSIYAEGGETLEVTAPANGFELDALAVNGRVTVDDALQKAGVTVASTRSAGDGADGREETRATGKVRGGGPMMTLRANRGEIVLRAR